MKSEAGGSNSRDAMDAIANSAGTMLVMINRIIGISS
jgi:hypothetical protein